MGDNGYMLSTLAPNESPIQVPFSAKRTPPATIQPPPVPGDIATSTPSRSALCVVRTVVSVVPSCVCVHICGSLSLQTLVQNVPRCDVMCCDVPCCAVLCCVVFRRAVCALPRFVEHCCAVLCCAAPGCAVLCCAAPGCAVPCYAVLWRAVLCRAVPYCAVWCWRPGRTPRLVGPILGPLWLQSGPMQE